MRAIAVALVAVAVLAACGGGGGGGGQPSGSLKVTMTEFSFTPDTITAPAGKIVFFLVNGGSSASHDMVIRDSSGATLASSDLVSVGDTSVFTVDNIAAGTYTYFCNQPGHEASGMKGTLTVT